MSTPQDIRRLEAPLPSERVFLNSLRKYEPQSKPSPALLPRPPNRQPREGRTRDGDDTKAKAESHEQKAERRTRSSSRVISDRFTGVVKSLPGWAQSTPRRTFANTLRSYEPPTGRTPRKRLTYPRTPRLNRREPSSSRLRPNALGPTDKERAEAHSPNVAHLRL